MSDGRAERLRALNELRQKRAKATSGSAATNSSDGSSAATGGDRLTSRHFAPSQPISSSKPKVLVPDSSPSNKASSPPQRPSYKPHAGHGVPLTRPNLKATNSKDDMLMLPSNFRSSSSTSISSSINSLSASNLKASSQSRSSTDEADAARPKKRVNTGTSTPVDRVGSSSGTPLMRATPPQKPAPSSSNSVESSPQVTDARRALSGVRLKSASVASSDDDDLPSLDGPRKRLVKGKKSPDTEPAVEVIDVSSSPAKPSPSSQGDAMARLKAAAPGSSNEQLRFVLDDEGGDVAKALKRLKTEAELLGDYKANASASRAAPSGSTANGSMKASSSRASVGAAPASPAAGSATVRGNKKSAIYAKRGTYDQDGRMKLCPICKKKPINAGYRHCSRECALLDPQAKARPSALAPPPKPAPAAKRKRTDESDSEGSVVMVGDNGKGKQAKYSDDSSDEEDEDRDEDLERRQAAAVAWFNQASPDELIELTSCTPAQAQTIVSLRPFDDHANFRSKINRKKGIGYKVFETYMSVMEGYSSLDDLLEECEGLGREVSRVVSKWAGAESLSAAPSKAPSAAPSRGGSPGSENVKPSADDAGIHLTRVKVDNEDVSKEDPDLKGYIRSQPAMISPGIQLKDYQLIGVNWLNLLWMKRMSCILADEMGLGKTIQVISLLAHIKEAYPDANYRHLIVVPPSTLENWVREFDRFAPDLNVQTYYGTQTERSELRYELYDAPFDVLVTTYNFAGGNEHDRKFFKKMTWETCVFDEGHMLKNFQSQRYENLMKITAPWRLLLTGTPLQNNLQELVSLLNFIMPNLFIKHEGSLRAIFKTKADTHQSFLSRDRVTRAKKMMTPFVLRRRKDQVLKDLPKKTERIEWCEMTTMQRTIYREALQRSRTTVQTLGDETQAAPEVKTKGKAKGRSKLGAMSGDTSSNVLMDLRKAASHPMLFRRLFDDAKIKVMARHCLREPEFCESNYNYVVEDMEVMTDAELQYFCKKYKSVNKHALGDECYLAAGKISKLMGLLEQYKAENKRVLIFSQFTQILDILQAIFKTKDIRYLLLTGSTAVDERQGLVDEFNEDEGISVFLLSTKAGGMGINLTAACVVIIFDQDFNPHNDKQACDRAYRIGQKRDVDIIKLITKGTIEEDMYRIGNTKLMLDDAVAGNGDDEGESKSEKLMKSSLLSVLRKQFEKEEEDEADGTGSSAKSPEDGPQANGQVNGKVAPEIVVVDSDVEMADGETKQENGRLEKAAKGAAIVA